MPNWASFPVMEGRLPWENIIAEFCIQHSFARFFVSFIKQVLLANSQNSKNAPFLIRFLLPLEDFDSEIVISKHSEGTTCFLFSLISP